MSSEQTTADQTVSRIINILAVLPDGVSGTDYVRGHRDARHAAAEIASAAYAQADAEIERLQTLVAELEDNLRKASASLLPGSHTVHAYEKRIAELEDNDAIGKRLTDGHLARIAELEEKCDALRENAADELVKEARLVRWEYPTLDGDIRVTLSSPLTRVIAEWAASDLGDAPNFITRKFQFGAPDGADSYILTIQRATGKTPDERYVEEAKKVAELEGVVGKLPEVLREWWSFDNRQQHTHSWHTREDFIAEFKKMAKGEPSLLETATEQAALAAAEQGGNP